MIKISKFKILTFKNKKYKCSVEKFGITNRKKEGDLKTPAGYFKVLKCFYRADKIQKPLTKLKCIKIKKNMGWCDDSRSKNYNKLIKLPSKFSYENLYRKDSIYDLILLLNYNYKPVRKNLGSAIFIHVSKKKIISTKGCIALQKKDLLEITNKITTKTVININK